MDSSRHPDSVRPRALYVFAVWTLLGVVYCVEMRLDYAFENHAITWWHVIAATMPRMYVWALLTPLIFAVSARFPARTRMPLRSVLAHVATWIVCLALQALATGVNLLFEPQSQESFATYFMHAFLLWIPATLVLYCATAGVAQWLLSMQRIRQHEREQALMIGQLAQAQLMALRMQLHPHFLFNTLNTIAILIRERDTAIAERLVTQLGDVLRQVLRTSHANETSLGEELAFLRTYLEIEQVRFGDRLAVQWHIDEELLDATVPVLLLQPLVENALRHGIARSEEGGVVEIGARRVSGEMELWVRDTGSGSADGDAERLDGATRESGSGLGLSNTRKRLEQLYPARARLTLEREASGGARARVTLPHARWTGAAIEVPLPHATPVFAGEAP
jgi:two-component system LytT family sensor kinase